MREVILSNIKFDLVHVSVMSASMYACLNFPDPEGFDQVSITATAHDCQQVPVSVSPVADIRAHPALCGRFERGIDSSRLSPAVDAPAFGMLQPFNILHWKVCSNVLIAAVMPLPRSIPSSPNLKILWVM